MSRTHRRWSRDRLVGVVVALACLAFSAVGLAVNEVPEVAWVDGVRGEPVSIARAQVLVGDVQVGTRLVDDGAVRAETTGMFVSVTTTLSVPGSQRTTINRGRLVTAERSYDAWSGVTLVADPGFTTTADLVFEVDPAQLDDLTLEIWPAGVVRAVDQRARIHLGITTANAAQWRAAGQGRSLQPDRYGTTEALP